MNKKINILLLGSDGMLGFDVKETLSKRTDLINKLVCLDANDGYDFTNQKTLVDYFEHSDYFDYVINCIAYTDTKSAENTEDGKELSYELNALVPKNIAYACNKFGTKLIHISTDWIFSENTGDNIVFKPYDNPYPVNNYGKDKLLGEQFIETEFSDNKNFSILRVSWLYGVHNNKSFIHKFLKNIGNSLKNGKNVIDMVSDEFSIPTSTKFATECIIETIENGYYGIRHAVPTLNKYIISRFDYASKILSYFKYIKNFENVKLNSITSSSYYPHHSSLFSDFRKMTWEEDLDRFMNDNEELMRDYVSNLV